MDICQRQEVLINPLIQTLFQNGYTHTLLQKAVSYYEDYKNAMDRDIGEYFNLL